MDLCLDVDRELLYSCSSEDYDEQQASLDPEQLELQMRRQLDLVQGSLATYLSYSVFTLEPHSASAFEALSSGGLAVFLVGASILAGRWRLVRVVMAALADRAATTIPDRQS